MGRNRLHALNPFNSIDRRAIDRVPSRAPCSRAEEPEDASMSTSTRSLPRRGEEIAILTLVLVSPISAKFVANVCSDSIEI